MRHLLPILAGLLRGVFSAKIDHFPTCPSRFTNKSISSPKMDVVTNEPENSAVAPPISFLPGLANFSKFLGQACLLLQNLNGLVMGYFFNTLSYSSQHQSREIFSATCLKSFISK